MADDRDAMASGLHHVEALLRTHYRTLRAPSPHVRAWVVAARLRGEDPAAAVIPSRRPPRWLWAAGAVAWSLLLAVPRPWTHRPSLPVATSAPRRVFVPGLGAEPWVSGALALSAPVFIRQGQAFLDIWGVYATRHGIQVAAAWNARQVPLLLNGAMPSAFRIWTFPAVVTATGSGMTVQTPRGPAQWFKVRHVRWSGSTSYTVAPPTHSGGATVPRPANPCLKKSPIRSPTGWGA